MYSSQLTQIGKKSSDGWKRRRLKEDCEYVLKTRMDWQNILWQILLIKNSVNEKMDCVVQHVFFFMFKRPSRWLLVPMAVSIETMNPSYLTQRRNLCFVHPGAFSHAWMQDLTGAYASGPRVSRHFASWHKAVRERSIPSVWLRGPYHLSGGTLFILIFSIK